MVPRPLLFGEGELSSSAAFRRAVCVRSGGGGMLTFALARCLRVEERRVGMFRDDYASKCDRVSSQETVVMNLGSQITT
jgi:hypothetical protein